MKEKIKRPLKQLIVIFGTILITLSAVIFSGLSINEQLFYFKIGLVILIILGAMYLIPSKYGTIRYSLKKRYKDILKIEGRIKKDIKRLKKGKKVAFLSVGDYEKILENKDKFKNIKDIEILFEHIDDYARELGKIQARVFSNW